MLKLSHGIEVGAWNAYQGHWQSLTDQEEINAIKYIQEEELGHQIILEDFLEDLGSGRSAIIDFIFKYIGKTMGFLCKVLGYRLPMFGAGMIETLGVINYELVAKWASLNREYTMTEVLMEMAEVEALHKQYFKDKLTPIRCLFCAGTKDLIRCNIYSGSEHYKTGTGFVCANTEECWERS